MKNQRIEDAAAEKGGQLLRECEKTPAGGDPSVAAASIAGASEYAQTFKDTATPERTARYWQELAAILPSDPLKSNGGKQKNADSKQKQAST